MAEPPFPGARLLIGAAEVEQAWQRLADGLQPLVHAADCILLGVMLGGMVSLVEIARRLDGNFLLDHCQLSRYRGALSGGELRWLSRPQQAMRGRVVVLVDDIFDQGHTLAALRRHCQEAGAERVLAAVLVRKRHDRPVIGPIPELVGLEVGDEFVFGCGMDHEERWRHLPDIHALVPPKGPGRTTMR